MTISFYFLMKVL